MVHLNIEYDLREIPMNEPLLCWMKGSIPGSEYPFMGYITSDQPDRVYFMRSPIEWRTELGDSMIPTFSSMTLPRYQLVSELEAYVVIPYQNETATPVKN